VDLEQVLDDLLGGLVKAGFVPGKVSKATRRGCKAARGRTLEALVAFRVFLTRCPEARNYLGHAGRHTFPRDDTPAGGEPLSRRGPEVALEEVFRQVGETGELGPDWLKMRGDSDGSGQQDDPPEGPAAAGRG
jgi:hypothetical protein